MLVVMPHGSLSRPANMLRFAPGALSPHERAKVMAAMQRRFVKELLQDIIPQVEKLFRVRTGAEEQALAGLSMDGGQTLAVLTSHPDQFGYVGTAGCCGVWATTTSRRFVFCRYPSLS
jgi:enterochelin esterase-like enzyme